MAIETKDLVIYKSERLTDNSDGGGKYSGVVVQDGISNNLFNDVSEMDRTMGDVSMRKIFPAVTTEDTDLLMGATVFVSELPEDPNVSALLFSTKNWTDERQAAKNRVENYSAKGGQIAGTPMDTHWQGMSSLQVAMFPQETESSVGDTIVLISDEGKALEREQYASSVRYNAVAYTYIPLDSEILGLSATRLPIDGRVPIFRIGGIGIVSSSKSQELPSAIAGTTYDLNDQRISWAELEDANGTKVSFDLYEVNYDYGRVTLGGDFVIGNLVTPLVVKYRYQDMGLIRDVQINGQLTFTKPLTHNYDAIDTIVGSALVIGDMQARYTRKFVQQAWGSVWSDEPIGTGISANYNDSLYPILTTNKGSTQERWAIVFTGPESFYCVGEYTGRLALSGSTSTDYAPPNPVTGVPYFTIKKEGWGTGWTNGNVLRFNTIASNFPVWVIRTVKQSEPAVLSDQFQIMLRGDMDRVA